MKITHLSIAEMKKGTKLFERILLTLPLFLENSEININDVAESIGMKRQTLYRKINELSLTQDQVDTILNTI